MRCPTAYVKHPISQGITPSLSVFLDTIVICSCTAFVIVLSNAYVPGATDVDGIVLTQQALVSYLDVWSQHYLTFAILLSAFSSIIYNYYLGETALSELNRHPMSFHALRVAIVVVSPLRRRRPHHECDRELNGRVQIRARGPVWLGMAWGNAEQVPRGAHIPAAGGLRRYKSSRYHPVSLWFAPCIPSCSQARACTRT